MSERHDIIVPRNVTKNGETKTYWTKIGTMFPSKKIDGDFVAKLDALPLPNEKGEVWISICVPKERDGDSQQRNSGNRGGQSQKKSAYLDDDSPF